MFLNTITFQNPSRPPFMKGRTRIPLYQREEKNSPFIKGGKGDFLKKVY